MHDSDDYKTAYYQTVAELTKVKKLVAEQMDTIKMQSETLKSQSATIENQSRIIALHLESLVEKWNVRDENEQNKEQYIEKTNVKKSFDVYNLSHVVARAPRHPEFEEYVRSGKMKADREKDKKDSRIVLIGRPELDGETKEQLTTDLKTILEENGLPSANIVEAFRVPIKKDETKSGYRPIKVVLRDQDHKKEVKAVLGHKGGHFARDDQTYLERERDRQLRRYVRSVNDDICAPRYCVRDLTIEHLYYWKSASGGAASGSAVADSVAGAEGGGGEGGLTADGSTSNV